MPDHHVNKVTLDFTYTKEGEENALQKTRAFFYDNALPVLSHVLDDVQQNVFINKLEIDVGITNPDEFTLAFQHALAKALRNLHNDQKNLVSFLPERSEPAATEPFFYYLTKGYWPWHYQRKTEEELGAYIDSFFKEENAVKPLLQHISGQEMFVATRFLHLALTRKKRWLVLVQVLQKQHPVIAGWLFLVSEKLLPQAFSSSFFYHRVVVSLLLATAIRTVSDAKQWLEKLVNLLPASTPTEKRRLLTSITKLHDRSLPMQLPVVIAEMKRFDEKQSRVSDEEKSRPFEKKDGKSDRKVAEDEAEKTMITNAGLILFHPFLPFVFADLKWIDRTKNFAHPKAQQKAILALQYLVNGKSRQPEHALVLNKLLCNWPLHLPVVTACKFSTKEKAALAELSSSLREHWEVLKNTSHRGLVESFVARPGLMHTTAGGYLLQIERKTIDILLESLPFGVNTIKLPWNEYIIYTEW